MNRIDATFARLRAARRAALIPYITAGDPSLSATVPLMRALTLVGVGVGTSAFLGAMFQLDHGLWAAGLIPLAIGVAQLVALKLEPQRHEPADPSGIDLQ